MFNPTPKKETTKHDSIHETTSEWLYVMFTGMLENPHSVPSFSTVSETGKCWETIEGTHIRWEGL